MILFLGERKKPFKHSNYICLTKIKQYILCLGAIKNQELATDLSETFSKVRQKRIELCWSCFILRCLSAFGAHFSNKHSVCWLAGGKLMCFPGESWVTWPALEQDSTDHCHLVSSTSIHHTTLAQSLCKVFDVDVLEPWLCVSGFSVFMCMCTVCVFNFPCSHCP